MKRKSTKIITALFALFLVFALATVPADAKVLTKKLKNYGFTTSTSAAKKRAGVVKKGTYDIKLGKKGSGYAAFKALKSKTYSFTLYKVRAKKKGSYTCGYFYCMLPYEDSKTMIDMKDMKTKGGKSDALYVASKYNKSTLPVKSRYLTKRTGKIALKKGQIAYLYFCFFDGDTVRLNIK